jgi:GNAT superfamily N-acetyltransferase
MALHAEVCTGDDPDFGRRFAVHRRQPGFTLAEARHGEFLVGYAYGAPLRQSTSWWRDVTAPLPADVTDEYPGRTFALMELAVRASWRRQGIGRDLLDLVLEARREERATTITGPGSAAARHAFANWGWDRVARTRDERGIADLLVVGLRR